MVADQVQIQRDHSSIRWEILKIRLSGIRLSALNFYLFIMIIMIVSVAVWFYTNEQADKQILKILDDYKGIITISQLFIIMGTLFHNVDQGGKLNEQIDHMKKELNLEIVMGMKSSVQRINETIMSDQSLLNQTGIPKESLLGLMILNDIERAFLLHRDNFLDEEYFKSMEKLLKNYMMKEFVRDAWEAPGATDGFHPEFRDYVNSVKAGGNATA